LWAVDCALKAEEGVGPSLLAGGQGGLAEKLAGSCCHGSDGLAWDAGRRRRRSHGCVLGGGGALWAHPSQSPQKQHST
jgi:hypothetical protein